MPWFNGYRPGVVCVVWAALCLIPVPGSEAEQPSRPNVLFILSDDQRADTIAALGNPHIRTPNLDKLAGRGFVFRNAYCMGAYSGAVCLPSRWMIGTGRTWFRLGPLSHNAVYDGPSWPRSMRHAGYFTYHSSKRHNTPQTLDAEFDFSKRLDDDEAERASGYPGKSITDEAVGFLRSRDRSKPFFMYLAYANPHDARVANPEWRSRYRDDSIPLPPNFLPYHPFDNGEMKVRDERLAPWPRTESEIRRQLADYYAVIEYFDSQIGRLIEALRESGELENTLIIFTSDHGLALGSHGLMGKQNLYEHSMKAPLIVSGPGIQPGASDALVYLHDLFPTACELAGVPVPEGLDGVSLAPVLLRQKPAVRDTVFLSYRDVQRAIRVGNMKLIRYPKINKTQLFDLDRDPHETQDLSESRRFGESLTQLTSQLLAEQKAHGDRLLLSSDDPAPAEVTPDFFK